MSRDYYCPHEECLESMETYVSAASLALHQATTHPHHTLPGLFKDMPEIKLDGRRVRTRVAPSPTGDPHVGTAYMALFNICFAKMHGGDFLLRIEDTDAKRSTRESEQMILDSLRWLGLTYDEGPDVGGPCGSYRQSERMHAGLYHKFAQQLLDSKHAFYCFCTANDLEEMRKEQLEKKQVTKYDGRCCKLKPKEVEEKIQAGMEKVVRMKVPEEGVCQVQDMLRGQVDYAWSQIDMQVLVKSDNMPTYHLANVVDDHEMEITHVIRGEEWLNSAPKHLLLYEYFGWKAPTLIHMPLLRNPDKSKLSKRKNPTSILYYKQEGILPEALCNFLALLGWSFKREEGSLKPGQEADKFSVREMMLNFDIKRMSLTGAVFDIDKLRWLNGVYLRELTTTQLMHKFMEWSFNPQYVLQVLEHLQPRLETLSDCVSISGYYFQGVDLALNEASFTDASKLDLAAIKKILRFGSTLLDNERQWTKPKLEKIIRDLASKMDIKIGDFLSPLYVAITGKKSGISVIDAMTILGGDMTRARVRHAWNLLGGHNNKELEALDKEYETLYANIDKELLEVTVEDLEAQVLKQGEVLKKLKTEKADKAQIDAAVKLLLDLKAAVALKQPKKVEDSKGEKNSVAKMKAEAKAKLEAGEGSKKAQAKAAKKAEKEKLKAAYKSGEKVPGQTQGGGKDE